MFMQTQQAKSIIPGFTLFCAALALTPEVS
jgi:hypothetical protein